MTGSPKLREHMICWLASGASSTPRHGCPRNSRTVRSSTTLNCWRNTTGSARITSSTECMPPSRSRALVLRPMPHTAPTSVARITASSCAVDSSPKLHTCASCARVAAGLAVGCLGHVIGEFGQRLGGGQAHAGGQAGPLQHLRAQRTAQQGEVAAHAGEVEKTLVDAVDLLTRCIGGGQRHHAVGHVAIELEVGRQRHQAGPALQMAHLEPRLRHLDAQVLGLVAARHAHAVVVRQHDHRPAHERRPEHSLATDVHVVDVDQRQHGVPLRPTAI